MEHFQESMKMRTKKTCDVERSKTTRYYWTMNPVYKVDISRGTDIDHVKDYNEIPQNYVTCFYLYHMNKTTYIYKFTL